VTHIELILTNAGSGGSGIRGVKKERSKPQPTGPPTRTTIRMVSCFDDMVTFGRIEEDLLVFDADSSTICGI